MIYKEPRWAEQTSMNTTQPGAYWKRESSQSSQMLVKLWMNNWKCATNNIYLALVQSERGFI